MGGPFRHQPPVFAGEVLHRERLVTVLAERWRRRLVTVVAGAGFGKTTLLVDAMAARGADVGRDVWLSCEAADDVAEHLVSGLRIACGLRPVGDLVSLCDWVWAQAPCDVCFVLDDVHEISAGSPGASVLNQLVIDLPVNGHLVLASREPVLVPTARLAASRQLVRVTEAELVFDAAEVEAFARLRGIGPEALDSSGGWPALAELVASAGDDLVFDYLWEEVLARAGARRARDLALFYVVGGGDDAVAAAVCDEYVGVADLVGGVPLVERSGVGEAVLHPLWGSALWRLVTEDEVAGARRRAAASHRRAGRLGAAIDLALEAEAWEDVRALLRDAAIARGAVFGASEFGRWFRALPAHQRDEPEAILASGLDRQAANPLESCALFAAAARGFAARGDVEGEVAAIARDGSVRWWANDAHGMLVLLGRLEELAAQGSSSATALLSVGAAAVAHIAADSAGVLAALQGVDGQIPIEWLAPVQWFRSVAHRRNGDLASAYAALDAAPVDSSGDQGHQLELARWRTDWLGGDIDGICSRLAGIAGHYRDVGDRYLMTESTLEWASKEGWLGNVKTARELVRSVDPVLESTPGVLARILRLITVAAIAVEENSEAEAAAIVRGEVDSSLAGPERWYWCDRAALALTYVLAPEAVAIWEGVALGEAHMPGLIMARALRAWRAGDSTPIATMTWPSSGTVRAHLPHQWAVELCAAGLIAGNPPPADLVTALGTQVRQWVLTFAANSPNAARCATARSIAAAMPVPPRHRVSIGVLGPLEVRRDGVIVEDPDLRRQRVRELLSTLVVHRRVRREQVAVDLWPEHKNPAHNLSVTLNYLQRMLQPEHPDAPYFVRATGPWLTLTGHDHLDVDLWRLEAELDSADAAERGGDTSAALERYLRGLPLWHGDPLTDLPDAPWATSERTKWLRRYTDAAVRAGELLLAAARTHDAIRCAEHALAADPTKEAAHRVVIRARLNADTAGALRAFEACAAALAEIGLEPDLATRHLVDAIANEPGQKLLHGSLTSR